MSDPGTDRLDVLRRNLDRLTREAEDLAESLERDRRLASEESVGAELLATRDLIAHLGIAWDTAAGLSEISARQLRHLLDDYAATCSALTAGDDRTEPLGVLSDHLTRRIEHLTEGVNQSIDIVSTQTGRAWDALFRLWAPFAAVVRQDWNRPRTAEPTSAASSHGQSAFRRKLSAPVR